MKVFLFALLLRKENFKGAIYHQTKRVASYLQSVGEKH